MLVMGLDIGAGYSKGVLMNEDREIVARVRRKTHAHFAHLAEEIREALLEQADEEVRYIIATGIGRYSVVFRHTQVTEVTCDGRCAWHLFPEASFVLDVGAQTTRALRIGERGKVREFSVNSRCAAGSGSFIERCARYLEVPLEEVGRLSAEADAHQPISSICAVLAESEIINHISEGKPVPHILRGVHVSLAERVLAQLRSVGYPASADARPPLVVLGGVGRQEGFLRVLQEHLCIPVLSPPDPDFGSAIGAALLALQRAQRPTPA